MGCSIALFVCTVIFISMYLSTSNMMYNVLGSTCMVFFLIFFVHDLIERNKKKNEEEERSLGLSFYDSLNLHPDRVFQCTNTENEMYSINIFHSERKIAIVNSTARRVINIDYRNIVKCDVQQDNSTIIESSVGNAIAGAIFAGTTGAVIGAASQSSKDICSDLSVRIITSDVLNPSIVIPLIQRPINRSDDVYKSLLRFSDKVYSTMTVIVHENQQVENSSSSYRSAPVLNHPTSFTSHRLPGDSSIGSYPAMGLSDQARTNEQEPLRGMEYQNPYVSSSTERQSSGFSYGAIPDLSSQKPVYSQTSHPVFQNQTFIWNNAYDSTDNKRNDSNTNVSKQQE